MDCRGTPSTTYTPSYTWIARHIMYDTPTCNSSYLSVTALTVLCFTLTFLNMDIIKHGLTSLLLFLSWMKGLTDGSDVTQTDKLWEKQGEAATINCSHTKDARYSQMYWYRQLPGETMKLIVFTRSGNEDHDFGKFSKEKFAATKPDAESGTFTVKNLEPEDKGLYFCAVSRQGEGYEAFFGGGTKLTVLEPDCQITKPTVQVLPPSTNECRNQKDNTRKKTIVCVATGFYPDHVQVSWQINGDSVTTGVATDEAALREDKFYKITSRLRVSAKDWYKPDTKFTCTVSFFDGAETTNHTASINGEEAKGETLTKEKYLRITQTAKFSYGVFIIKSITYGAFVGFLVWKLQSSAGKQNN